MKIGNDASLIPTATRDGKVNLTYSHRVLFSKWAEYVMTVAEAKALAAEILAMARVSERLTEETQLAFALPSPEQPEFSELDLGKERSLPARRPLRVDPRAGGLISNGTCREVVL
jgi:hypothetical protein